MAQEDIIALIATGALGLVVVVMAIVLLSGRGSFLIAGFNTMSKAEKARYDEKSLCRFVGRILLPIGILLPLNTLGAIYGLIWINILFVVVTLALVFFAVIYANTGNRFKK